MFPFECEIHKNALPPHGASRKDAGSRPGALVGDETQTTFLSFSVDRDLEQLVNERANRMHMSRSWYIRCLIQSDLSRGGNVVIKAKQKPLLNSRVGRRKISLRVDPETARKLEAEAKRRGATIGDVIDELAKQLPDLVAPDLERTVEDLHQQVATYKRRSPQRKLVKA